MAGATFRRLGERDIDDAVALTGLEAWGYTREDFLRLLALSPEGCIAAELDGRLVGLLTTTAHGRLAFLGAVIVRPELRGQGIGRSMMETALEALKAQGIETVRLYAYLNRLKFYEDLGFRREHRVVRWTGTAAPARPPPTIRPVTPADLPDVAAFDEPFFGAPRQALLARLAAESPSTFLVGRRDGRVAGFIVGMRSGESVEVGPWVVEPTWRAGPVQLFAALTATARAASYSFGGPAINRRLVRFVRRGGYQVVFRTLQMIWGREAYAGRPDGVWAVAGLEKG